jgi:glutaredoxin-like protein NrdH
MAYKDFIKKVDGKNDKNDKNDVEIFVFALSTCGWCRRTKDFLNGLGVEYSYVDVDLLSDDDQSEVEKVFEKYDTEESFPKIIIDNKIVISGFDEKELRKVVGR